MNLDNNNMCNEIMTTSMHSKSRRSSSCVIIRSVLLLCNVAIWGTNAEWIDIDTPLDKRTTTSLIDKTVYHLVSFFESICLYIHSCFWVGYY